MTRDPARRVRRLYELSDPHIDFANRTTRYVNIGYWERDNLTIDEAGAAMAIRLAEAVQLGPDDDVVDVGCGYGEQDFLWLREGKARTVHALDVTPTPIRAAHERAVAEEVADRLHFEVGSATELPLADACADRVVALDSAMHFPTREVFFREALRVLRPGGLVGTIDTVPLNSSTPLSAFRSPRFSLYRFGIPEQNWYDGRRYAEQLTDVGFIDVNVTSVRDHTWEPWFRHWSKTPAPNTEQVRKEVALLDHVLAVAAKPPPPCVNS